MSEETALPTKSTTTIDFSALYNNHPEYIARRQVGSFEQARVDIEVHLFKLPYLMGLLPSNRILGSALEIGCATGELIAAVPVSSGGKKVGIDISSANVESARIRFPEVSFRFDDFRKISGEHFDVVIMSDVLEHVPDDPEFLRDAAVLGDVVLVNLPLEDNWLNRGRNYGVDDISGHLRKYSLNEGLKLFERAELEVMTYSRVWFHETPAETARRALRDEQFGSAFSGSFLTRAIKRAIFAVTSAVPVIGRRMFASNLFVMARQKSNRRDSQGPVS